MCRGPRRLLGSRMPVGSAVIVPRREAIPGVTSWPGSDEAGRARRQPGFDRANGSRAHPGIGDRARRWPVDAALCLERLAPILDGHAAASTLSTERRENASAQMTPPTRAVARDGQNSDVGRPAQAVPPGWTGGARRECAHCCPRPGSEVTTASHCARIDGSCVAITTLTILAQSRAWRRCREPWTDQAARSVH